MKKPMTSRSVPAKPQSPTTPGVFFPTELRPGKGNHTVVEGVSLLSHLEPVTSPFHASVSSSAQEESEYLAHAVIFLEKWSLTCLTCGEHEYSGSIWLKGERDR